MSIPRVGSPIDIAVSGLRANSARMNVISSNIANSSTTRTPNGDPYRRKDLVLSTNPGQVAGVQVGETVEDMATEFPKLYEPGHPDADANGYVQMPNVQLPVEMINLVEASRAYQANAAVMRRFSELSDTTLELLK